MLLVLPVSELGGEQAGEHGLADRVGEEGLGVVVGGR